LISAPLAELGVTVTVGNVPTTVAVAPLNISGLVAHYLMNDTNGTTILDNIVSNTGTGTYASTTGKVGGAVQLGSSGINIGNNNSINFTTHPFSYSAWVNLSTYNQYSSNIIGSIIPGDIAGGTGFGIGANGKLYLTKYGYPAAQSSTDIVPTNSWHLVTLTYGADDSIKFYIDGVADSGGTQSYHYNFTQGTSYIGALSAPAWGGWVIVFTGLMDDVRIYNKALTGPTDNCTSHPNNEVCQIYNSGAGTEAE
jgi:hypothetical protein